MSYWATPETRASFSVKSLLIARTLSCNMSLLTAIKAICQLICLFLAVSMIMVWRAALVAKSSSFIGWTVSEYVLPWSAFKTSLLVPFLFFCLQDNLLFLFYFLLYSLFFLLLDFIHLFFRINNIVFWILKALFELGQLMIQSFSFGFVLLYLFCLDELS